ncbi:hypothetical protein H4219_002448 [Mycoemilia scoparia]|uniref:Uncharacterized protein n=1 Tax=Mycoemilia scoparia TaxID=417184 RepID=A0A9W8DUT0_9FUNG|nr:hypothetical protein H4219_002448 [Mycoemilia scoparia]
MPGITLTPESQQKQKQQQLEHKSNTITTASSEPAPMRSGSVVSLPAVEIFNLPAKVPELLKSRQLPFPYLATSFSLQHSIHPCSRRLKRELRLTFPEVEGREDGLFIIPTFQPTEHPMISYYDGSQEEKDEKLFNFYRWAALFVKHLKDRGFWGDATDPASGLPLFTTCGPSLYPDVEGAEMLLRYNTINIGCCGVVSHPTWGTKVYPATAFAIAPPEAIAEAIRSISSPSN